MRTAAERRVYSPKSKVGVVRDPEVERRLGGVLRVCQVLVKGVKNRVPLVIVEP